MSKTKKRFRYIALVFFLCIPMLGFMLYEAAPYFIIKPRQKNYNKNPAQYGMKSQRIVWTTSDSLQLVGWATFPEGADSLPAVLFLHGIGNCKETWVNTAGMLYQAGIASVAFDGRAHGESEGEYCTFGFYEKNDVRIIADWMKTTYPERKVGVWGNSLGGAIALQSLATDKDLDFGVISSTFADMEEVVQAYQKRYCLGIKSAFFAENALHRAATIAQFDPKEIRPEESAKKIEQPIFYIHGTADNRIDVGNAQRIFNNLASPEKELHLVDGASHFNVWYLGGQDLQNDLMFFLKKQKKIKIAREPS